ncbi:MAG: transposase [Cycloclasticus sp.]|nr:transposase [Cycloclasticus sp.]
MSAQQDRLQLVRNQLIVDMSRNSSIDEIPVVDRVIWVDEGLNTIGLFEVTDPQSLPRIERLEEIVEGLHEGQMRILKEDSWLPTPNLVVRTKNQEFSKKEMRAIAFAESRFNLVESLFSTYERELFDPKCRGKIIRKLVDSQNVSKPTAYTYLRTYFKGGMCMNAFLPEHHLCGAPGVVRVAGTKKRGRPPKLENRTKEKPGINIDSKTASFLKSGWLKFRVKEKRDIAEARDKTLEHYFAIGYKMLRGGKEPILPDDEMLPTKSQFIYWGTRGRNLRHDALSNVRAKDFNLKNRSALGSARSGVNGPGDVYQVDASGGLVHLVAKENRGVRIKKAVVYVVIDTYSQLVTGWCCVLENSSYAVLAMALESAFTSKVAACKRLNIEIQEEDWPASLVCTAVLGDKGPELMGHQSDNACAALKFDFKNTPTGRADWKPYVERIFGHIKKNLADIPGATVGPKKRASLDEAENATLNLDEFEEIFVSNLISFNHSHIVRDHVDEVHLQAEGLAPTPINYWNWGLKNRSGLGKAFPAEYIRSSLLPKAEVSAEKGGLKFKELRYQSAKLLADGSFWQGTNHRSKRYQIAFDPRDLSEIWLIDGRGKLVETCPLTQKYAHFRGISYWELINIRVDSVHIKNKAKGRATEERCGLYDRKDKIIKNAKQDRASIDVKKAIFNDGARRKEQGVRRSKTSWTGLPDKREEGEAVEFNDFNYIPAPDYDE